MLYEHFYNVDFYFLFPHRDNLKTILQSIYSNKDAVDDELVEVFIALLLPQSKSLVNFLLFVAFDLRHFSRIIAY